MKTLLLDAGNTAVKWRIVSSDAPWSDGDPRGAIPLDMPRFAHEIGAACRSAGIREALRAAPGALGHTAPQAAGCCVAPQPLQDEIDRVVEGVLGRPVDWYASAARFETAGISLDNGYRDPAQLGADRWHALIGARALRPRGALLVVSAGTATTVDTITAEGRFLGGVIVPGIGLMRTSLAEGTARLPLAGGGYTLHPDNTDDAIHTGIIDAQIGLIERRLRRIRAELPNAPGAADDPAGRTIHVLLSGGNAGQLYGVRAGTGGAQQEERAAPPETWSVEPDLVLRGLWLRSNREPSI